MPSVINTNVASLNAQRNLSSSQTGLTTALQRLSSGLRINSAKDDAAGMAISERFTTQIRGLNQAVRNANDGISLAQTGEAALGELTNNLQRVRELALQASNSTNSSSDRAAIQLEVAQRLAEIDRTASQTSFNGQKLLDGSFGTASFQIGANAGESISIGLGAGTNMRNSATGAIATATAGTLGATGGYNGRVATAAVTQTNFTGAGAGATAGRITFTATDFDYSGASGLIAGTSSAQAITNGANFSTAGQAQVDGTNVQAAVDGTTSGNAYDFTADLAQFDISDGVNSYQITLTTDYTDETGLVNAINSQLSTAGSSITVSGTGAGITFTNNGSTNAVTISNADANAITAGFANSAGTAGSAAQATTNATLTIDGVNITLNGNNANYAAIASELTTKMQASALGANYSASINGSNELVITNSASHNAVAITNVDANAAAAGFSNSTGVAGSAAAASQSSTITVDGQTVNLNANYGNAAGLVAAFSSALGGSYTVSNVGNDITIARSAAGIASTAINITADATFDAGTSLTAGVNNGVAGANGTGSNNAQLYVDGNVVNLTTDYTDVDGVAAAIQAQLQAVDASYSAVQGDGTNGGAAGTIVISKTGMAAVNITGADSNATAAGIAYKAGEAGQAAGTINLTAFSINGTSLNGNYASVDALATAINSSVSGVFARNNGGNLQLSSSADITLAGADATGGTGFNATSVAANSGSLASIDVSTTDGALQAIQRIDSTLQSVSTLRSTFGAIQNRFESVINSLSSTSENLTSARSRIQDADFAAETASLTRAQILQQAGTAMLAQANGLPNGVLALLRG